MFAPDEAALVAVILPRPEAAAAAVAAWEAGEAVLPLDPAAPGPDLERALATLRPTHLLDADGRRPVAGGVPVAEGVVAVVATSGTTGERKGVELTLTGLEASSRGLAASLPQPPGSAVGDAAGSRSVPGGAPGDRLDWLCCLPVHSVGGLAVVGRAWAAGAGAEVLPAFDMAAVIERGAGRGVSLVPTILRRMLDSGAPVDRFAAILLGGGTIDPQLLAGARAAGAAVHTSYGMTETWGGVVHDGHPLAGVDLRLADGRTYPGAAGSPSPGAAGFSPAGGSAEAGTGPGAAESPSPGAAGFGAAGGSAEAGTGPGEDGADEPAEILVRGAMVMRGYRFAPEATAAVLEADGWYRTGDAGRFEPETGRLRFVERMDDLINTGGVKVSPTAVERVLATHPAIADVAVRGRPDPEWGERVAAFVVPADPAAPPGLEELREHVQKSLPRAAAPREIVVTQGIPRSEGGKILRRRLG